MLNVSLTSTKAVFWYPCNIFIGIDSVTEEPTGVENGRFWATNRKKGPSREGIRLCMPNYTPCPARWSILVMAHTHATS